MAVSTVIHEVHPSIDDVHGLIDRLSPIIDGVPMETVAAAFLMLIILSQDDEVSETQLAEGIKGASGWIVTYLTSLHEAPGTRAN